MTFALRRHERHHGDRLTVVVLPSSVLGSTLLDLAGRWAGAGLINAAAWVLPEDVSIQADSAPVVRCHFVGPWGDFEGNLFEIIGQHQRDLVRVVVAQVLESATAVDKAQIVVAAKVHAAVSKSVPAIMLDEKGEQFGTEVLGVNLITGVTGLHSVSRQVIDGRWNVNLVTSPEDRRDPSRANTWIRAGENLPAVALTSICAVGGLFAGVPQGPFDETPADESQSSGRVRVVRTTVRAILGEGVIQEIVRRALKTAPDIGGPAMEEPQAFAPSAGDGLIAEALDWALTLDQAALRRGPVDEDMESRPRTLSIAQGMRAFLRFYGEALIAIPTAIWAAIRRQAESAATLAIVGGEESGFTLQVAPDASLALGEELLASERRDIARGTQLLASADRRSVRLPNADLWRALHQASESLLDGGDMPSDRLVRVEGSRRVIVSSPAKVVPHPARSIVVGDVLAAVLELDTERRRTISSCDPATFHRIIDGLVKVLAESRQALEQAREVLAEYDRQIAQLNELQAAADAAEQESDKALLDALEALGAAREKAMQSVSQGEAYVAALAAEENRLGIWAAARSGSLLWQLGDAVQGSAEQARTEEADAMIAAVAASGIDADTPRRLRRSYFKGVGILAVFMAVAAAAVVRFGSSWVSFFRPEFTWIGLWFFWVAWVVALVLVFSLIVRSWYVGTLRYLRRFVVSWNSRAHALRRALSANSDRRRLEVGSQQLASWSDIIGWTIHKPWTLEPPEPAHTQDAPDPTWFPVSVRLAYPSLDADSTAVATNLAVATITKRGWRRRAFERLVGKSMGVVSQDALSRALEAIESDTTGENGARSRLQESLQSGVPHDLVVDEVIEEGARRLREKRLGAHRLRVHLQRLDPDEVEQIDDRDFLGQALVKASPLVTETWSDTAAAKNRHVNPGVVAWASVDAQLTAASGVKCSPTDPTQDDRQALVDVAVRFDMTEWVDVSELRLFEARTAEAVTDEFAGDGDFT